MRVWLIADTHFNHRNLTTYCQRPTDFTAQIVRNWQRLVAPSDLVLHLGDVLIGPKQDAAELLGVLPGRKVLVMGNHDAPRGSATWWMRSGFDFACQGLVFRGVWLTHEPATECPTGTGLNVHGHLHNIWDGFKCGMEYQSKPFHRLFALEYTDLAPVEFDKFVRHPDRWRARKPT